MPDRASTPAGGTTPERDLMNFKVKRLGWPWNRSYAIIHVHTGVIAAIVRRGWNVGWKAECRYSRLFSDVIEGDKFKLSGILEEFNSPEKAFDYLTSGSWEWSK